MSLPAAQQYSSELALNDREQIQYLLGNPPSWMMHYGIYVMVGVFAILLTLSYLVRYPDMVDAKVMLTTTEPPIRVMAKSDGRVTELLIADNELAEKGQVLAALENTANWRDVLHLESWLDSTKYPTAALPAGLQLGALQYEYSNFSQHWKDLDYFARHNGVAERIAYLQQQITGLNKIGSNLQRQRATMQEEFSLAEKAYRRQQRLHQEKIISDKEFETSAAQFLAQKRQLENAEAAALQNDMQIKQHNGQIIELKQGKSDHQNEKELALGEDIQRLRSAIAVWKNTFLITAPISGYISFSKIWSAQQAANAGTEVLAIVPTHSSSDNRKQIIGKASIPALNSGKIKPGQRAIINLDGYPAQQYGILETTVKTMSLLPQEENHTPIYLLNLYLPDTLLTSYHKHIPFRQEMTGHLRIITEDQRVIERIFDSFRNLLKNT